MESDNDDTLTKPKTKRSEKQIEAFEKARQARQAYLNEKKMKEEETKKKRDTLKEIKNELNGKPKAENGRGKPKIKEEPIVNNKYASSSSTSRKKEPIYESDSDSVDESEEEVVEEEIIIMKKPKKKKPVKKVIRKVIMQESSESEVEDEEEEAPPPPKPAPVSRNTKTQQNARSKIVANPVQSAMSQYYFMD